MALPIISFNRPHDLHLLRGQSIDLAQFVSIDGTDLSTYEGNNANADISFRILTQGASNPDGSFSGNIFSGPGFSFNTTTKVLQIDSTAPSEEIYNFIFTIQGVDTDDPPAERNTHLRSASIRIHIHGSVAEAWITPSLLTAYVGINSRASVYVRFDDGITAQIGRLASEWGGSSSLLNVTPPLILTWSCPSNPGLISHTGFMSPSATGSFDIEVAITNPVLGVNITAHGTVRVSDALSANSSLRADLVACGDCPGFSKINEVPNILFIPDGFVAADESKFNQIVDNYVQSLMSGNITAPFNYLKGSINFWKLFVPSRQAGASTKGSYYRYRTSSQPNYWFIKSEKPGNLNTSDWSAINLMYYVGFPVYGHSTNANSYNSNSPLTSDQIRSFWKATTSLSDAQVDSIPNNKIDQWRTRAERKLPEELDTALGIYVNNYDAVEDGNNYNMINFNSKRITRRDLDTFLATLRDGNGNLIGDQFVLADQPTGSNDSNGDPIRVRAKDFDNIVVLTTANQGRANNGQGFFFLDLNNHTRGISIQDQASKAHLVITNESSELTTSQKATLTHELCHSFGLEDEYGESPPIESYENRFIDDAAVTGWQYTVYDADPGALGPEEMDWSGNVQARQDLLIDSVDNPGTLRLHTAKLKWRYHRILKCGVLNAVPVQNGDRVTITLREGHADQFQVDESVFLRKRRARSLFTESTWHRSEPIHGYRNTRPDPLLPTSVYNLNPTISPEMEIKAVNSSAHQLEIEPVGSSTTPAYFFSLEDWEEIIVYKPQDAPEDLADASYRFAEVISRKVLSYLHLSPFAFNAKEKSTGPNMFQEVIDKNSVQQSRIPGSLVPSCSRRKKQIVALYSNGNQYHGHVYHPTGQCLMRTHFHSGSIEGLCEVCKYVIVNIIDPTKHGILNSNYSGKIYPT